MDGKENGKCGSECGGGCNGAQGRGGACEGSYEGPQEGNCIRRSESSLGEGTGTRGYVYFIETHDGAFVKIGYSIHVPRRFNEIGILLPGLRLIGYIPGTYETELWLHGKFAAHRERGEWFRHTDDVRKFIGNLGLIAKPKTKNTAAVALGSLGGKARKKNLTAEERSAIARKAGKAGGRGRAKTV